MAKYNVKHLCGHAVTHQIFGTNVHGERDRKIEWLSSIVCLDCARKEALAKAKEENKSLPQLKGTEKQVNWAEQIRMNMVPKLKKIREKIAELLKNPNAKPYDLKFGEFLLEMIDLFINTSNAAWWIDHRDDYISPEWFQKMIANKKEYIAAKETLDKEKAEWKANNS